VVDADAAVLADGVVAGLGALGAALVDAGACAFPAWAGSGSAQQVAINVPAIHDRSSRRLHCSSFIPPEHGRLNPVEERARSTA
jgi:hypothetical protein